MARLTVVSAREPLAAALRAHFETVRAEAVPQQPLVQGQLPDAFLVDAEQETQLPLVEFLALHTARPIVVLAEETTSALVAAYLEAGADAVLREAGSLAECVARLKSLTRRSASESTRETSYRFGDVLLYPERRSVLKDGVALHFTRTEFNLLRTLAERLDMVTTHRQLMSEVWGQEYLSARHYLRVYVRRVREKIEADPNCPRLLIACRAKGYMLRSTPDAEPIGGRGAPALGHRAGSNGPSPRGIPYAPSLAG